MCIRDRTLTAAGAMARPPQLRMQLSMWPQSCAAACSTLLYSLRCSVLFGRHCTDKPHLLSAPPWCTGLCEQAGELTGSHRFPPRVWCPRGASGYMARQARLPAGRWWHQWVWPDPVPPLCQLSPLCGIHKLAIHAVPAPRAGLHPWCIQPSWQAS